MTTTQKTNEEIADKCIFRAYSEHTPERKDKMLREKLVEALNTKDREKDEAVAEAVKRERERCVAIIFRATEIPKGARNPTRDATVELGEKLVRLITQQEALTTPNQKDHERN